MSPQHHQYRIGERVRVIGSAFTTTRRSRIAEYHTSSVGLPCYWLADGGLLFDDELETDELPTAVKPAARSSLTGRTGPKQPQQEIEQ